MFIHLHGINKDSFEEYRKKHLIQIGRTALGDEV
jgi:hypothetical protein